MLVEVTFPPVALSVSELLDEQWPDTSASVPSMAGLNKPDNILTHTDRSFSRPVVVLLANPHRHPNEAKARVALVHHAASVVVVLSVDLPIDDGVGYAAVPGWMGHTRESFQNCEHAGAGGNKAKDLPFRDMGPDPRPVGPMGVFPLTGMCFGVRPGGIS